MELCIREIFFVAGLVLLALAGASGWALFFWSIGSKVGEARWGVQTLWGLFLVGLIAGVILITVSTAE